MPEKPEISVIIASYNSRDTIEGCLKSLEAQKTFKSFEIIVVDSSTDGTGQVVEKKFPNCKVCRFSERKFPGAARNIGIAIAKGNIIAFIDADCQVDQHWMERVLKAHESPHFAIGGAVANANPDSYVGWAAYFVEFSKWMPAPETQSKWMDDIAGASMSYKKEVFNKYGSFIEGTYCSDTDFHWRLWRDSHRLQFVPSICVSHHNIENFGQFLKHEFHHGLCFSRVRIQSQGFSRWKRLVYVALSFLIPLKLFLMIVLHSILNPIYLSQFLKSLPLVALGVTCWSLGETVGYMRGQID